MLVKTLEHQFPATKVKFSIFQEMDGKETFYYACAIDTNLAVYSRLTDNEKVAYYGAKITDGKDKTVFYRSHEKLVSDLLTKFGLERLASEK
jgi:hypothetical protein